MFNKFQLLNLLNKMHLTIPSSSKLRMLDELAAQNANRVIEALRNGKSLKITVDNIDGRMLANQVKYLTIV